MKSAIQKAIELEKVGANGNRIKHAVPVFEMMLSQQRRVDPQQFENEMRLGNPNAPLKIIMVSNLYCNPCKLKHEVADQLMATYPDKINLTLRFVRSGKDTESVSYLLNYWKQTILGRDGETENAMKLMHDWFDLLDLQKFKRKYPVKFNDAEVKRLETQLYAWTTEAEVNYTPSFFINGYELPKEYALDDLLAMVPSLADSLEKTVMNEITLQNIE